MAVYVDTFQVWAQTKIRCFKAGSCHMTADTLDELHAMARKIGLRTPLDCPECPRTTQSAPNVVVSESGGNAATPADMSTIQPITTKMRSPSTRSKKLASAKPGAQLLPLMAISAPVAENPEPNSSPSTTSTAAETLIAASSLVSPREATASSSGCAKMATHQNFGSCATIAICRAGSTGTAHMKKRPWCWFQEHPRHPHYDLTESRRTAALAAGAVFIEGIAQMRAKHAGVSPLEWLKTHPEAGIEGAV